MPAATSKAELIAVTEKEWDKLSKLLDSVPEEVALQRFDDGVSIKDTVAHRAHWIDLFLGWYADGMAGRPVHFPAEGYKWSDLKAYNAALRQAQAGVGWDAACAALRDAHARLLAFLEAKDDAALYGGPMKGARNDWTPGRWAEAAGPSHYRSAAKFIRSCLRQA
jgi:hypothetical protein